MGVRVGVRERLQGLHVQDSIHSLSPSPFFSPPDPNILLGKTPIKVVKEAKFLGLIFDTKLTFKNRVQYLKSSCQKAQDILPCSGTYCLGSRSYRPPTPLPCVSPLQTGLRIHCVRIGPSVGSEAVGSDPPSRLTYRVGGFPHVCCPKSQCGST